MANKICVLGHLVSHQFSLRLPLWWVQEACDTSRTCRRLCWIVSLSLIWNKQGGETPFKSVVSKIKDTIDLQYTYTLYRKSSI